MSSRWKALAARSGDRALNIAHRGGRAFAPENTIEAIEKAALLGADMVEIDVHLSRDGLLVVIHDDDLARCSDATIRFPSRPPWCVRDFSLAEIQSLDAGSWYVAELAKPPAARQPFLRSLTDAERLEFIGEHELSAYASGRVRHPGLLDCLVRARDLSMMVNVEIKNLPRRYPGIVEKTVAAIAAARVEHLTLVSSFDHEAVAALRRLNGAIATAVLTQDLLYQPEAYLARLDADALHPECLPDDDAIAAIRSSGRGVNVWTENDPRRMRELIDAGVTGIMTDYPNRLRNNRGSEAHSDERQERSAHRRRAE